MTKFSWLSQGWQLKLFGSVAIVGTLFAAVGESVLAQIVPDNTLGAEGSVITPDVINGIPSDRIDGGATRSANLFHSFSQFNVGEGRGAYFTNPAGILNILSRVTGANRSDILGRLGVLGNANLFLINPNGIVFGQDASLDVQGSFLATTADAIKLGDVGLFSASQPATSNLLTVSPSALWFNAVAAQPIVNQSQAPSSFGQPNSAGLSPGLQVQPGRTLALVGGDVLLEGGRLTAAEGRIELGSVARVGQVSLSQTGNRIVLGYDSIDAFGTISLSNGAFVDASGEGGGDVQIRGARLEMTRNSNIWADTLGAENGGEVLVRTTEVVLSESSSLGTDVLGTGTGGDLTIDTERLLVRDGGQVGAGTFSGKGGSLLITASESVRVIGTSADGRRPSGLFAQSLGSGDSGDLTIDTGRLLVSDGGQVGAGTGGGSGKGGSLLITASELVEVIGESADGQTRSGLAAQSRGNGDAGNLRIDTRRLLVQDGAQVATSTLGSGKGGRLLITASESVELIGTTADARLPSGLFTQTQGSGDAGDVLRIDTRRLLVQDGAQVAGTTFGSGKGGSLLITASDSVELIGRSANGGFVSGLFTVSDRTASGNAGDFLRIDTGRLLVRDGANISSRSFREGIAGNINITARDTLEANNGTITTSSDRSSAGGITITASNIRLFGDSDITTRVNSGAGDSGNIDLKADSILSFDDSDILAFAENGRGGDINLDTPAFFGENYRPAPRNTNPRTLELNNQVDINADAAAAANSGTIARPDTTFIQNSLTELPDNQINTDSLLANSCIVRRNQPTRGSFTITGTGGLPQRPGDAQMSTFPTVDIETLPSDSTPLTSNPNRPWQKGDPIVEPQGVYRLPNGKLVMSRECP
ncbi:filamentous hemagglutinin N-terminal domain-containing protein [Cyanobacteria bacterium FACHB-472]|nr:filamentous hemagglutinin N-terminal domain-containing protein [Cyanobacteria bacterium FACHB-472]